MHLKQMESENTRIPSILGKLQFLRTKLMSERVPDFPYDVTGRYVSDGPMVHWSEAPKNLWFIEPLNCRTDKNNV